MVDISFKQYYLNKALYWLFSIVTIMIVIVSIASNWNFENLFVLTGVLLGVGINVLLYLNRFEVKHVILDDEAIEITYYEQMYFGRAKQSYLKTEIKVFKEGDVLILSNDKGTVAKIRRKALNYEDWGTLENYFA
ncbi:MAG: hypothetical protein ACXVIY_01350 [Mucilaginibacter sp.]